MTELREKLLRRNCRLMFWIKAVYNVKVLNSVVTLFYLHRGLTLSQLYYLAITWSVVNLISEVPSSYLADTWGRKNTLIIAVLGTVLHMIILFFAASLCAFIASFVFLSFSFACYSGTDQALLYDTKKELGEEDETLTAFGKYSSAAHLFKVVTPLLSVFIAKDLLEWQFIVLIIIDLLGVFAVFILVLFLSEPVHFTAVHEKQKGLLINAISLIKRDKEIIRLILSQSLILIGQFIFWRYHQKFFLVLGISVILIGVGHAVFHSLSAVIKYNIKKILKNNKLTERIDILNKGYAFLVALFVVLLLVYPNIYLLFTLFILFETLESIRYPFYSELFNKKSKSYNRATTLSLMNFVKSLADIPLLIIASFLVSLHIYLPVLITCTLSFVVIFFLRTKENLKHP